MFRTSYLKKSKKHPKKTLTAADDGEPSTDRGGVEQRQAIRVEKRAWEAPSGKPVERKRRSSKSNQPAQSTDARKRARGCGKTGRGEDKDMQECAARPSAATRIERLKQQHLRNKDSSAKASKIILMNSRRTPHVKEQQWQKAHTRVAAVERLPSACAR